MNERGGGREKKVVVKEWGVGIRGKEGRKGGGMIVATVTCAPVGPMLRLALSGRSHHRRDNVCPG